MSDGKNPLDSRKELILGDEMKQALEKAAELKKNIIISYKEQNKSNYDRFYEIMLLSRTDIQSILDKKRKDRTDAETEEVKRFKKETAKSYRLISELLVKEELEEGELSKVDKLADKVASVAFLMRYIGRNELEDALRRKGITLSMTSLDDSNPVFENANIKKNLKEVLESGGKIKTKVKDDSEAIKTSVFESSVPSELVYSKESNKLGIKASDWSKLVGFRTKLLIAENNPDRQEKIEEEMMDMAGEKQFDMARSAIVRHWLSESAKNLIVKQDG